MQPKFKAFNEHAPVHVHHRDLPHWQQQGATYFVTFRHNDALPKNKVAQWRHERSLWLKAHGIFEGMTPEDRAEAYTRINPKQRENFERQCARRLFTELDQGHGCCLLRKAECRDVVRDSLHYHDGQRYCSGDYVIMPNHVHWIVQPLETVGLQDIMQSIKRFTSTQLSKRDLHKGKLWQSESYDRLIRDRSELERIRKYIADNPAKANLPKDAYTYYSAGWLDG